MKTFSFPCVRVCVCICFTCERWKRKPSWKTAPNAHACMVIMALVFSFALRVNTAWVCSARMNQSLFMGVWLHVTSHLQGVSRIPLRHCKLWPAQEFLVLRQCHFCLSCRLRRWTGGLGSRDRRQSCLWCPSGYQSLAATKFLGRCCPCLLESSLLDQNTAGRQQLRIFPHFQPTTSKESFSPLASVSFDSYSRQKDTRPKTNTLSCYIQNSSTETELSEKPRKPLLSNTSLHKRTHICSTDYVYHQRLLS